MASAGLAQCSEGSKTSEPVVMARIPGSHWLAWAPCASYLTHLSFHILIHENRQ